MGVGWVRVTYLPPGERGLGFSLSDTRHGDGLVVWVVGEGEGEGKGDVPSSR